MRRMVGFLSLIIGLSMSVPAWADLMDCGSSTTPESADNREMLEFVDAYSPGTTPLHSTALALVRTCDAIKQKFSATLSALGVSRSNPPTDAQIDQALDAAISTPRSAAPLVAPKAMSRNVAVNERNRVESMDTQAASLVQSSCGGYCSSLLEGDVNAVIREVEKLNADPEYLAQLPRYEPIKSVQAAARLGWTKENGFWVNNGAPQRQSAVPNAGTFGSYLLSVDECKKLRDRLAKEVMSAPTKEPVELSFFEAECLPQLPGDRAAIAAWKSGFTPVRSGLPDAALMEWTASTTAEEKREAEMIAADEAQQKVAEEKMKTEEEDAIRQEAALALEEQRRATSTVTNSTSGSSKTPMQSEICSLHEPAKSQCEARNAARRYGR